MRLVILILATTMIILITRIKLPTKSAAKDYQITVKHDTLYLYDNNTYIGKCTYNNTYLDSLITNNNQ